MENSFQNLQIRILEIMKFIDSVCRENGIQYFIMGGTALGAVRHGGFIPWDDDLDIFMTTSEYVKFKDAFANRNSDKFVLQEWSTVPEYLEYAKVRMNGTTFIEEAFKDRTDLHQGIYVDIMILHKVPLNKITQRFVYLASKFVTLYGLSSRNWKPKSFFRKAALSSLKVLPCRAMARTAYSNIYKHDKLSENYCYSYWITPAKFKKGLFDKKMFSESVDIAFEDTVLMGSPKIKEYLSYRYGDYMKLPSAEEQKAAVHALYYSVDEDYSVYLASK